MATPILKAGQSGPLATGERVKVSRDSTETVIVEGPYAMLKAMSNDAVAALLPENYVVTDRETESGDAGLGRMTVVGKLVDVAEASQMTPLRTTYRIGLEPVTYDLEDHPKLAEGREEIIKWLATDEAKRVQSGNYFYLDANGVEAPVTNEWAIKFCNAWMAGIKTFNRYYPVVEKISVWKQPPGLTRATKTEGGKTTKLDSFTGGSPTFSQGIGTFSTSGITLAGYDAGNFFKSHDSWVENENHTWTRTEQWTYTPDGPDGPHGWIYAAETQNGGAT